MAINCSSHWIAGSHCNFTLQFLLCDARKQRGRTYISIMELVFTIEEGLNVRLHVSKEEIDQMIPWKGSGQLGMSRVRRLKEQEKRREWGNWRQM